MATGHSDHWKRVAAPKSWGLKKLDGVFALRPATGRYKITECIPLAYLISRILGYAENNRELAIILKGNAIKVNGRAVTKPNFPVGLFDVISIEKKNEHFRLLYNVLRKFHLHRINPEEARYRLANVVKKYMNVGVPYVVSSCGASIRFCDPKIGVEDAIKIDNSTRKVVGYIVPGVGKVVFVSRGKSRGRVGVISSISIQSEEKIYEMTDFTGNIFSCTYKNCILIGESKNDILITLTKDKGIKSNQMKETNAKFGEMIDSEALDAVI